jgi:hypothetical protein
MGGRSAEARWGLHVAAYARRGGSLEQIVVYLPDGNDEMERNNVALVKQTICSFCFRLPGPHFLFISSAKTPSQTVHNSLTCHTFDGWTTKILPNWYSEDKSDNSL